MDKCRKLILMVCGIISFVLGTIGIFLPLIPTVPLYLLAVCCFANSNEKLHQKLVNAKLYQKHVACFSKKGGVSLNKKIKVVFTTLIIMSIVFLFCPSLIGKICIIVGFLIHCYIMFIYIPTTNNTIDIPEELSS